MKKSVSKYARIFDENNLNYTREPIFNYEFIKHKETFFNNILNFRGYVFLRDVYYDLGFGVTKESIVAGWVKDGELTDGDIRFDIIHVEGKEQLMYL